MTNRRVIGNVEVPACTVVGGIDSTQGITGVISQKEEITGSLATAYTTAAKAYEGNYEITPTVDGQTLETKQRYMTDDVTILAIPFYEVGNTSGGDTVYIANNIEMEM